MKAADRELVEAIIEAYRRGYFPMAERLRPDGPRELVWISPDPRCTLPLEAEGRSPGFHVPRSLARVVRQGRFRITTDRAFEGVIRGCAAPRAYEPETWIDKRIIGWFCTLHGAGIAHSIEAWLDDDGESRTLVGGLYGLHIGGAFFAESKFSRPEAGGTDASKVCLVQLVHHLRRRGFGLLDVQMSNPHLEQFGIVEVSRAAYLRRLRREIDRRVEWGPFEPERTRRELIPAR